MHNIPAIRIKNLTKVYKLYPNPWAMTRDLLGLDRCFFWMRRPKFPEFEALKEINLDIFPGERVGIVGRNGAGKTTLLKHLTGNFEPTSGEVEIHGAVQSLMDTGLGFHPEFTGYENIKSSLVYNNLSPEEIPKAIGDVVDFVELGEFLHQPIKTYSLGMMARLGFATATAIRPDILVIDEVLSAGDAYFAAKSADRMKRLTGQGCTLLLVSHSMGQLLQFCERVIWLNAGRVVADGNALEIIKAYEAYIREIDDKRIREKNKTVAAATLPTAVESGSLKPDRKVAAPGLDLDASRAPAALEGRSLSRWPGQAEGLKIAGVRIIDANGQEAGALDIGAAMSFELRLVAESSGEYTCRYHVYIYSADGVNVAMHLSDPDRFYLERGETRTARLHYKNVLLNRGRYVITVALYESINMDDSGGSRTYDLIDRSFEFQIASEITTDRSIVKLPAEWEVEGGPRLADYSPKANRS